MKISFVIPAYNEEKGIGATLESIPVVALEAEGFEVERLVIDNASTDKTADIAKKHGARVVYESKRGYGNAYHTGFFKATGDIIISGDADMTYPFEAAREIIQIMDDEDLDFINTDRLSNLAKGAMQPTHVVGNYILSTLLHVLYGAPFKDSQSGMWIFKRSIWPYLSVEHTGMPFSQEIKIEAYTRGFRCGEVPINYRRRIGQEKLSVLDAWRTTYEMIKKRITHKRHLLKLTAEEVD